MSDPADMVTERLHRVLAEMESQPHVASSFRDDELPFDALIVQLHECLMHNEWGIAYESIVATLEAKDFKLSGKAAVALVEVALLLGFKTERPADKCFDRGV